jgi:DNA replication and repair protein RecF
MIKEITLAQFKKHKYWNATIESNLVFLCGNNATGKTSILEAISLFSPGSGVFNSNLDDLISFNCNSFQVNLHAYCKTELTYITGKKEIKINQAVKRPLEVLEYMRIYGLTPYIALAFWKDTTLRRKHIDRLIMQNDPLYGMIYAQYAKALKERNKLIETRQYNSKWEQFYTPLIVENGLKITQIRDKVLKSIAKNLAPSLVSFIGSELEIKMYPSLEEQEAIFAKPLDIHFMGPHKSKFDFITKDYNGMNASTGQQKKILLALTISALPHNSDTDKILILDDLFTTLDTHTAQELLSILAIQPFQTWITHTQELKTLKTTTSAQEIILA